MHRVEAVSMAKLERLAAQAAARRDVVAVRAGTSVEQTAPGGLGRIVQRSGSSSLGTTGGLTLVKSAAAFTIPSFATRAVPVRTDGRVQHFAEVMRTAAGDATHESFYPGPGDHLRPGMTQRIGHRVYQHYWSISPAVSALIRQGEEEHLADAQRAFDITYKLIADAINALAGQRFGPSTTPAAATALAEAELARRLPSQLGTGPGDWVKALDRLLLQTRERDRRGWHGITTDPPATHGHRILHPVVTMGTTRVGSVPSSQVVNY